MSSKPRKNDPRAVDPRSEASKKRDLISRGDTTPTPLGKTLFVLLRGIEPILQYSILAHGLGTPLLHRIGLRTLPAGLPASTGLPIIDNLNLSPYRLVLLGMSIGSALKQNIWVTALSQEPMSARNAVLISLFNAFFNSVSSYAFLLRATSASLESNFPQPALIVGTTLYTLGLTIELVAEVQRKQFKADPKNAGKPYTGGLWRLARHINYGAYTVWRAGYAMVGGGWVLGGLVGAMLGWDFASRGVPILNEYCEKRYGRAWEEFKERTPWRLVPWVY